jgi:hypothetical protein
LYNIIHLSQSSDIGFRQDVGKLEDRRVQRAGNSLIERRESVGLAIKVLLALASVAESNSPPCRKTQSAWRGRNKLGSLLSSLAPASLFSSILHILSFHQPPSSIYTPSHLNLLHHTSAKFTSLHSDNSHPFTPIHIMSYGGGGYGGSRGGGGGGGGYSGGGYDNARSYGQSSYGDYSTSRSYDGYDS